MRTGNGPEAARRSERVERADWALRQRGVRTPAKLALVVMAMDAQHRDGITLAGPQTVAERSGMRECEAEHALLALEHQGMVEVLDTIPLQAQYDLALAEQRVGEAVHALPTATDGSYISAGRRNRHQRDYTLIARAS